MRSNFVSGLLTVLSLTVFFTDCSDNTASNASLSVLYDEIDREIEKVPEYDAEKQKRISDLKKRLHNEKKPELQREITYWIIAEYEAFNSDSALYYVSLNLDNPVVKQDKKEETSLKIKQADIAAHAGLFGEASLLLAEIPKELLDSTLLENYYSAYCDLYQYQSEYATDSEFTQQYEKLRKIYIDSLRLYSNPSSINFVVNHAAEESRKGNYIEAETILTDNLKKYRSGERNYSILASILADLHQQKGDKKKYREYLGESVISDIRGAVKENMAIRALATECYKEGDFERADRYLRQSFADANFYSARMRNAQSSRMLPIIGEAYSNQQKSHHRQLTLFIIFISVLACGFIILSVFSLFQVKKIRKINKKTKETLEEVSKLSGQLKEVNADLVSANEGLQKMNAIQQEYGVLFMEYCSTAISALQKYQQSLKVAATQGNLSTLVKKIDSTNIESKMVAEFYSKFDEAILNLYPNYVEKFNGLLRSEDKITLKPNEALNTELRVFALIKIGISDSEKIAKFLRCSLSTVYTYRSKMKKKALNPDEFEQDIMNL